KIVANVRSCLQEISSGCSSCCIEALFNDVFGRRKAEHRRLYDFKNKFALRFPLWQALAFTCGDDFISRRYRKLHPACAFFIAVNLRIPGGIETARKSPFFTYVKDEANLFAS